MRNCSQRRQAFAALSALLALTLAIPAAFAGDRCQILDNLYDPIYRVQAGLLPRSRTDAGGSTTVLELDADWEMGFFRLPWGEADLYTRMRNSFFIGSGGMNLPSQATALALDVGWTMRFGDGKALQLRARPGLYADGSTLDSRGWHTPFSCSVIQSFYRNLSGIVGLDVRPGFDRTLMPIVGLKWEPFHWLGIEPRLPQSRIVWFVTPEWSAYGSFAWRNDSYALHDERRMMTIQDFRIVGGVSHRVSHQMELSVDVGRVFSREVKYRRPDSERHEVSQTLFARIGVGGPF